MSLFAAVAADEGFVAAAAGPAGLETEPATARGGADDVLETRLVGERSLVAAAGTPGLVQDLHDVLPDRLDDPLEAPVDRVVEATQDAVVDLRSEALERVAETASPDEDVTAPEVRALVCGPASDGGPRFSYVDEHGLAVDRTDQGYALLGTGELFAHVCLDQFPIEDLGHRAGLLALHRVLDTTSELLDLTLEDPPRAWQADAKGPVEAIPEGDLAWLDDAAADLHRRFRKEIEAAAHGGGEGSR